MPMQTVNVLPSQPLLFQKKAIAADITLGSVRVSPCHARTNESRIIAGN